LAGLMIMPGGFALMLMMPVAGFLISKYDARLMIAFGLLALGLAMLFMAHQFSLDVDFRTMMWARVFQTAGWRSSSYPSTLRHIPTCAGKKQCRFRAD